MPRHTFETFKDRRLQATAFKARVPPVRVRIGEKIRVSIGNGHLGRESEAGRAASERRTAKTKARAERG